MADSEHMICAAGALSDGGLAVRFEIESSSRSTGAGVRAFTVRFRGKVYAYENRCPHRGTELDWNQGEVFDQSGLYLVCATHGALFEPTTGLCIAGPCYGAQLEPIAVEECKDIIRICGRECPQETAGGA